MPLQGSGYILKEHDEAQAWQIVKTAINETASALTNHLDNMLLCLLSKQTVTNPISSEEANNLS